MKEESPESGGEMEARVTEIAMGDWTKRALKRVGEDWIKSRSRLKKLETADRECIVKDR